jgi:SAM-dependent methyltransferase
MVRGEIDRFLWKLSAESRTRLDYTRKAFGMLPRLECPSILDAGCGEGAPTLEIARLSGGEVFGLDIRQSALAGLARRSREAGLSERIYPVRGSLFAMPFPDGTFDLIWAEASIHIVGLKTGLAEWRRYIRPMGFFVIHEMAWLRPDPPREVVDYWVRHFPGIGTVSEYVGSIARAGYRCIGHFQLPDDLWWREYYRPLEEYMLRLRKRYAADEKALGVLDKEQREVDLYKKYRKWYGSAFLVMQRKD